jgi:hypothetical protein
MEKELARQLIPKLLRAAIGTPASQAAAASGRLQRYALGIASATDAINQALLNPALAEFPELSRRWKRLKTHGRYL